MQPKQQYGFYKPNNGYPPLNETFGAVSYYKLDKDYLDQFSLENAQRRDLKQGKRKEKGTSKKRKQSDSIEGQGIPSGLLKQLQNSQAFNYLPRIEQSKVQEQLMNI